MARAAGARRVSGLLIDAVALVGFDPDAAAVDRTMVTSGFMLRPFARARFISGGRVRARMVWRCRASGKTMTLEITFRSDAL